MHQIPKRAKVILFGSFNQTEDCGAALSTAGGVGKEKIPSAHHKRLDASLRPIVADLQSTVLNTNGGSGDAFFERISNALIF
jgi:hypothetical protein